MTTSFTQLLDGELVCGVCLEFFDTPLMLPCSHNFCKKCIINIVDNQLSYSLVSLAPANAFNCPVCQQKINLRRISIEDLPVNRVLESIISLYKTSAPVDIFDSVWNTDQEVILQNCSKHDTTAELYCETCGAPLCTKCQVDHGQLSKRQHVIVPFKETMVATQADIASILTDIKKKSIPLNDRIQLLEEMLSGVDTNESQVKKQLEHQCSAVMSSVRQRQEELKRVLSNEMTKLKQPVEEQLRKCKYIRTTLHEMMKKLSVVRKTKDSSLKLKLMKDTKKQLNSLLCFDIAWSFQDSCMPEVTMPTWDLDILPVQNAMEMLSWQKDVLKVKTVSTSTQTDAPPPTTQVTRSPPPYYSSEHSTPPLRTGDTNSPQHRVQTDSNTTSQTPGCQMTSALGEVKPFSGKQQSSPSVHTVYNREVQKSTSPERRETLSDSTCVSQTNSTPLLQGTQSTSTRRETTFGAEEMVSPVTIDASSSMKDGSLMEQEMRENKQRESSPVRLPSNRGECLDYGFSQCPSTVYHSLSPASMTSKYNTAGQANSHGEIVTQTGRESHHIDQMDENGVQDMKNGVEHVNLDSGLSLRVEGRKSFPPDPVVSTNSRELKTPARNHYRGKSGADADREALSQFIARRSNTSTGRDSAGGLPSSTNVSVSMPTASVSDSNSSSSTGSMMTHTGKDSSRELVMETNPYIFLTTGGDSDYDTGSLTSQSSCMFSKKPVSVNLDFGMGRQSPPDRKVIKAMRKIRR